MSKWCWLMVVVAAGATRADAPAQPAAACRTLGTRVAQEARVEMVGISLGVDGAATFFRAILEEPRETPARTAPATAYTMRWTAIVDLLFSERHAATRQGQPPFSPLEREPTEVSVDFAGGDVAFLGGPPLASPVVSLRNLKLGTRTWFVPTCDVARRQMDGRDAEGRRHLLLLLRRH